MAFIVTDATHHPNVYEFRIILQAFSINLRVSNNSGLPCTAMFMILFLAYVRYQYLNLFMIKRNQL